MSKLLLGNTLSHDNASPLWLSSDSPEAFKKNSIESGFRERWENIKITYDLIEEVPSKYDYLVASKSTPNQQD